jgi:hypothetical protein
MTTNRAESLIARRDQLAKHAAAMAATPEAERPTKPAALKAWVRELAQMQDLIEELDSLIKRVAPEHRACRPDVGAASYDSSDVVTIAKVPKGKRAEVRVSVKPWQGRRVVDIRLWSLFDGSDGEMRPSRKGIAFDASKLDALIDALHQAKQHV